MAKDRIGSRRLVVGAHYGLRDWLAQRITALVMVTYTLVLLVAFLCTSEVSYASWRNLFSQQWFKLLTFVSLLSLFYHAWIGVRDIWMDYVKPVSVRLLLQVLTILWLLVCAGWSMEILWRG